VYGTDEAAQRQVIEQIRQACLEHGFFQLINHGVPSELVDGILAQSDKLFDLPHDVKKRYSKGQVCMVLRRIQLCNAHF
jgi:isopenicillin N synthase-like dioxygenase